MRNLLAFSSGRQFSLVTLEAFKGCDTTPLVTYTLEDVTVDRFASSGSTDQPLDAVTLRFKHIVGKRNPRG